MPAVPPARQDVNSEGGSTPPDQGSRSESELERRAEAMPTSVSAPELALRERGIGPEEADRVDYLASGSVDAVQCAVEVQEAGEERGGS